MMRKTLLTALLLGSTSFAQAQDCYDSLDTVFNEEAEADVTVPRRYVLCPNTVFELGTIEPGVGVVDGQPPLVPRSNAEISCGEDGAPTNNCVLTGGGVAVSSLVNLFYGDERADNVVIKGLTFEGQSQYGIFLEGSGQYHFDDCVIQGMTNNGAVYVTSQIDLDVKFTKCLLQNNAQAPPGVGVNFGVVTISGEGARVEIDDCIFYNNSFGDLFLATIGYAVQVSNGGDLIYKNSCLIGNAFLGPGPLVLNEGTSFVLIGSYADITASLLLCQNIARFRNAEERENLIPQCVETQKETCSSSIF